MRETFELFNGHPPPARRRRCRNSAMVMRKRRGCSIPWARRTGPLRLRGAVGLPVYAARGRNDLSIALGAAGLRGARRIRGCCGCWVERWKRRATSKVRGSPILPELQPRVLRERRERAVAPRSDLERMFAEPVDVDEDTYFK